MAAFMFVLVLFALRRSDALQCLNGDGSAVDWWFAYKVNDGLFYAYYEAKSTAKSLTVKTGKTLADQDTALGRTLTQIWQDPTSVDYIAYNVCRVCGPSHKHVTNLSPTLPQDEPPFASATSSYGHTKGVFGYDQKSAEGLFLIHSWPKLRSTK